MRRATVCTACSWVASLILPETARLRASLGHQAHEQPKYCSSVSTPAASISILHFQGRSNRFAFCSARLVVVATTETGARATTRFRNSFGLTAIHQARARRCGGSHRGLSSAVVSTRKISAGRTLTGCCGDDQAKGVGVLGCLHHTEVIEIARSSDSHNGYETGEVMAPGGQLQRFLESEDGLRLLDSGGYRGATMTERGFLVLHGSRHASQEMVADCHASAATDVEGLRVGPCCWTVIGNASAPKEPASSVLAADTKAFSKEITPAVVLRREIENLVPVISSFKIAKTAPQSVSRIRHSCEPSTGLFDWAREESVPHRVLRLIARLRANVSLANAKIPPARKTSLQAKEGNVDPRQLADTPSSPRGEAKQGNYKTTEKCEASNNDTLTNPLLLAGVGQLLSPRDCDTIVSEARNTDMGAWQTWDGDVGSVGTEGAASVQVVSLSALSEAHALWQKGIMQERVLAQVASTFGVQQSSVTLSPAENTFVCKMQPKLPAEHREATESSHSDGVPDIPYLSPVCSFRRSASLVAFAVVLTSGDEPAWALCLEQKGRCVSPIGQGAGVIISGKRRHAVVNMAPSVTAAVDGQSPAQPPAVFVLRGFASIRDPSVREDVAGWRWGSPAWHVDASWVKDEDILNRAWAGGERREVGDEVSGYCAATPEKTSTGAAPSSSGVEGDERSLSPQVQCEDGPAILAAEDETERGPDSPVNAVAREVDGRVLQPILRVNSTLAHRYYRQRGRDGMSIPLVDGNNCPLIDLVPQKSRAWFRKGWGQKSQEVTIVAVLRQRFPLKFLWSHRRQVGKVGLSLEAGTSGSMDAALQQLFGGSEEEEAKISPFVREPVPPIKFVYVDPRYRGLRLGRRLFLEAMCYLAQRGFRFALIVVEDNGTGGLFGFYEEMGFVKAEHLLGIPRAMIAPIPPPPEVLQR